MRWIDRAVPNTYTTRGASKTAIARSFPILPGIVRSSYGGAVRHTTTATSEIGNCQQQIKDPEPSIDWVDDLIELAKAAKKRRIYVPASGRGVSYPTNSCNKNIKYLQAFGLYFLPPPFCGRTKP